MSDPRFLTEPERAKSWNCSHPEDYEEEIPTLYGKMDNGWRFEIKPIDGQLYYNLAPPLTELDEWESPAVEDWSLFSYEETAEALWEALENADSLTDLADADNFIVKEFGTVMEMLEREGLGEV